MKVLIGADVVSTKSNESAFITGKMNAVLDNSVLDVMNDHDYRIVNLETPLYDGDSPILKCGPNLKCPTEIVKGLQAMHIDAATLANNHILDHGIEGLSSTEKVLTEKNIVFFGVGNNVEESRKPLIIEKEGLKIGVYGCCEHEFSCATDTTTGANPFDPIDSFDDVCHLSDNVDYVIVLYHGGKEYYRYPSPWLQKVCRKFVSCGANLVVCQHSHCVGCKEDYGNGTIIYGQGNFVFDLKDDEFWNTGLLISLHFDAKKACKISYIPIDKKNGRIAVSRKESIISRFDQRSREILEPKFIQENYTAFSRRYLDDYLISLSGKRNFLEKALNRLTKGKSRKYLLRRKHNSHSLTVMLNYIECEAHRDLLIEGIKDRIK